MDFHQLRLFLNVAALKSFSRTAELMYISQPSVSTRVKALEDEVGAVLFDRSRPRKLTLTEAGKLFVDYAQRLVNLHDESLERLSREARQLDGAVQLGASTVPGIYLLPQRLALIKQAYPGIGYSLAIRDSTAVVEYILDYGFDLGFVGNLLRDERLAYFPFAEDELILAAPPGLFKAEAQESRGTVALDMCLPYNLLIREKGSATRQFVEKVFAEQNIGLRDFSSVTYIDSLEGIKQGVRHGLGISILSRYSAEDYLKMGFIGGFKITGLDLSRQLYLVHHKNRVLSRPACLYLEYFQNPASLPTGVP